MLRRSQRNRCCYWNNFPSKRSAPHPTLSNAEKVCLTSYGERFCSKALSAMSKRHVRDVSTSKVRKTEGLPIGILGEVFLRELAYRSSYRDGSSDYIPGCGLIEGLWDERKIFWDNIVELAFKSGIWIEPGNHTCTLPTTASPDNQNGKSMELVLQLSAYFTAVLDRQKLEASIKEIIRTTSHAVDSAMDMLQTIVRDFIARVSTFKYNVDIRKFDEIDYTRCLRDDAAELFHDIRFLSTIPNIASRVFNLLFEYGAGLDVVGLLGFPYDYQEHDDPFVSAFQIDMDELLLAISKSLWHESQERWKPEEQEALYNLLPYGFTRTVDDVLNYKACFKRSIDFLDSTHYQLQVENAVGHLLPTELVSKIVQQMASPRTVIMHQRLADQFMPITNRNEVCESWPCSVCGVECAGRWRLLETDSRVRDIEWWHDGMCFLFWKLEFSWFPGRYMRSFLCQNGCNSYLSLSEQELDESQREWESVPWPKRWRGG